MFKHNFKYELKILLRSKWLLLLFFTMLTITLFAGYNGKQKVDKRFSDIEKAYSAVKKKDSKMLKVLDSLEKGFETSVRSWAKPTRPMHIGYSFPRVAAMPPQALTFISTGQSDLFTHYVQPKAYGDSFLFNYAELSNPIQLLFGSFDLSFVIIYILPLIVIAFSYNIFSSEKESGSLKLLASQPVSMFTWILQKIGLRFLWLTLITLVILTITFVINEFDFSTKFIAYINTLLLVIAYILFWFVVVLFINIFINNSAKNAVSLLAVWVFIILIIPAIIGQLSNVFYPIPSRSKLISEVRELKDKVSKKQDKILDNYLRDHPEYASNDSSKNYSFWHKYMASQDLVEDELKPLITSYDVQLEQQQRWIQRWQYSSPAIILQEAFNNLAGTSTLHYQNYRKQTSTFAKEWRNFFVPLLYKNEKFSTNLYSKLPSFEYKAPKSFSILIKLISLCLFSLFFISIAWINFKNKLKKGTLISN